MLLLALLCLIVGALAWLWQSGARFRAMGNKIPGPRAYPIVGNALQIGQKPSDFLTFLCRNAQEYAGGPFRLWLGPTLNVFLTTPEDIEKVLNSKQMLDKGPMYRFFQPFMGLGLGTVTGDKYREHRKILTPSFSLNMLTGFVEVFNANSKILVEQLKTRLNGPGFDIYKDLDLCTLDIICETACSAKINAQLNSESEYVHAVRNAFHIIITRFLTPWLTPDILFNLSSLKSLQDSSQRILHGLTEKFMKTRREEILREKASQGVVKVDEEVGSKKRLALLDMLIESSLQGSGMTDVEIRDEVDTFMFAGHDTTVSSTSFAAWVFAWNQDIQDKVYSELMEVCPDKDADVTFRELQELKYLDMVFKEIVRMYPAVPLLSRTCQEDLQLSGGYVVPKGAPVYICPYITHHNPKLYPDPERFDPDRFLPENTQGRHPFAYIPFSAGIRNCIGQKYAVLETKAILAHILRHFKILPATEKQELDLSAAVVLHSTYGIQVKLVPRC